MGVRNWASLLPHLTHTYPYTLSSVGEVPVVYAPLSPWDGRPHKSVPRHKPGTTISAESPSPRMSADGVIGCVISALYGGN
jgi:hypothetical protein